MRSSIHIQAVKLVFVVVFFIGVVSVVFAGSGSAQQIDVNASNLSENGTVYDIGEYDDARAVIQTQDNGHLIAGSTDDSGILVKINVTGSVVWTKTYDYHGANRDAINDVIQTADGGFVFVGETQVETGNRTFWVTKTTDQGVVRWQKIYGGSGLQDAQSVIQTDDGGYAVVGENLNLLKLDTSGAKEWTRDYGSLAMFSVVQTSDGGYILAGLAEDESNSWDGRVIKTDSSGNTKWSRFLGGSGYDRFQSVTETTDGGYALAGYTRSFGLSEFDSWLVKLSATGETEWNRSYGTSNEDDYVSSVIQTRDGFVLGGLKGGSSNPWVFKTNKLGYKLEERVLKSNRYDQTQDLMRTDEGEFMLVGGYDYGGGANAWSWTSTFTRQPMEIAVSPSNITDLSPGETFTVNVTATSQNNSVYAIESMLAYNTSVLNATEINKGEYLGPTSDTFVVNKTIDHNNGIVTYGESRKVDGGVTGQGAVFNITFEVTGSMRGIKSDLTLSEVQASNQNKMALLVRTRNGTAQVPDFLLPTVTSQVKTKVNNVGAPVKVETNATDTDGTVRQLILVASGSVVDTAQCTLNTCNATLNWTPATSSWNSTAESYDHTSVTVQAVDSDGAEVNESIQTEVYIAGDATGDGSVDIFDAVDVGTTWSHQRGEKNYSPAADLNNDGIVNVMDAAAIGINWKTTAS